jgi:hypothetical protein
LSSFGVGISRKSLRFEHIQEVTVGTEGIHISSRINVVVHRADFRGQCEIGENVIDLEGFKLTLLSCEARQSGNRKFLEHSEGRFLVQVLRLESVDPVSRVFRERVERCMVVGFHLSGSGQDVDRAEGVSQSDFAAMFWLPVPAGFTEPHALWLSDWGKFVELNRTIVPRLWLSRNIDLRRCRKTGQRPLGVPAVLALTFY